MFIEFIGSLSSPVLMTVIIILALKNKINIFESFRKGALEGFECILTIMPAIIGLITAVTMFKESGAMEFLSNLTKPLFEYLGIPKECVPLIIMKPISGSGSNAILSSIFSSQGPDSSIGRLSSIIYGSSEAIFYIVSTYCGFLKVDTKKIIITAMISYILTLILISILFEF